MKKAFAIFLSALCSVFSFCFVSCGEKRLIPDGNYAFTGAVYTFVYVDADVRDTYGWVIDGNTAERWVSGSCEYKAKVIEKGGKIHFDGYKWRGFFDVLFGNGEKQGSNHDYIVIYDENEKSIFLTPVDISSEMNNR